MSWNYRVLAFEEKDEVCLRVCEVYYDKEDVPNGYIENKAIMSCEGIKGLKWTLNKCKGVLKKPILYAGIKFPHEFKESE